MEEKYGAVTFKAFYDTSNRKLQVEGEFPILYISNKDLKKTQNSTPNRTQCGLTMRYPNFSRNTSRRKSILSLNW